MKNLYLCTGSDKKEPLLVHWQWQWRTSTCALAVTMKNLYLCTGSDNKEPLLVHWQWQWRNLYLSTGSDNKETSTCPLAVTMTKRPAWYWRTSICVLAATMTKQPAWLWDLPYCHDAQSQSQGRTAANCNCPHTWRRSVVRALASSFNTVSLGVWWVRWSPVRLILGLKEPSEINLGLMEPEWAKSWVWWSRNELNLGSQGTIWD